MEAIVGPYGVQECQAVHPRQPDIEDYEVGLEPLRDREPGFAVGCDQHQVTVELELQLVHTSDCDIVFNQKHSPLVVGLEVSHTGAL